MAFGSKKNQTTTQPQTIEAEQPKQESTELAIFGTSQSVQLASDVPEYLRDQVGNQAGSENVDQNDQLIPRLGLAQDGMSPQLKKTSELYIPGLQGGQLFNTLTGEIYGESVKVVPLSFFKNYIEFTPIEQGGGVKGIYDDASQIDPAKLAFTGDKKPAVTEFKNRLCLILQEGKKPEPIVVSFKSSGLKTAKKWNSLIKGTNLPAFARVYELSVVSKAKGQQTWYGLDVQPDIFVPQAFFNAAQAQFEMFQKAGVKVDLTGIDNSEREPGSDDDQF